MNDFIITSLQTWDSTFGGNAKDIAYELSLQNRVLYVNPPAKDKKTTLRKIRENLWVLDCAFFLFPVNRLPDGFLFDLFNKYNNRRIFKEVNKYARELGFRRTIHFCDNDVYRSFYARDFLQAEIYIYYRRDNLHPVSYWSRHVKRLEPAIIRKNDLIMCNSAELARYALPYKTSSFVHDIGQGVDLSAYRADHSYDMPEDCKHLPSPLIGYIGALNSARLDIDLLYHIAQNRPHYTFLFIGKEDAAFKSHSLRTLSNVHFSGLKPMNQMPAYTKALDVCLNPQAINEITIGNYPRKIDEYLAMGKPVVATHTHTMELFKDYVYLCSSVEEYLQAIDKALSDNSQEKQAARIVFAHTHSWTHCVNKIYGAIDSYENQKAMQ